MSAQIKSEIQMATRVTLIGAVLDLALGIAKIFVGLLSNSYALISDGVHSLSDLFSDAFVLGISRFSRSKPDHEHPYGHGRFETLGTIIVAIILFVIAGIILFDAFVRLKSVDPLPTPGSIALLVAFISVLSKEWIYRYTRNVATKINSSLLLANAWHSRTDAFSSIAVLFGVGGTMLGFPWMDLVAAMVVALMIAWIAYKFIKTSFEELVDTAVPASEMQAIEQYIQSFEGSLDAHNIRSRFHAGKILLDIHLRVQGRLTVSEGHYLAEKLDQSLKDNFNNISDVIVHIDPEEGDDPRALISLPSRKEVIAVLEPKLSSLLPSGLFDSMQLHYLNNRIEIDFYIDKSLLNNEIENIVKAKCKDIKWLGAIKLFGTF